MIKKIIVFFIFSFAILISSGYVRPDTYKIDAQKNAIYHNDMGLKAVADGEYIRAVQEFCIAISLNPRTQATAVYYNNLGETYMKVGYYKDAEKCFETALIQYNLNFLYYQNLVKSFKAQGKLGQKIKFYQAKGDKNPLTRVMLGLLYIANGDRRRGIIKLDEFCMREPNLLITDSVRSYLQTVVQKK